MLPLLRNKDLKTFSCKIFNNSRSVNLIYLPLKAQKTAILPQCQDAIIPVWVIFFPQVLYVEKRFWKLSSSLDVRSVFSLHLGINVRFKWGEANKLKLWLGQKELLGFVYSESAAYKDKSRIGSVFSRDYQSRVMDRGQIM